MYPKVATLNARYFSVVADQPRRMNYEKRKATMLLNKDIERTDNDISSTTQRKIKKAINWMISTSDYKTVYCKREKKHFRFKLNFLTLTLPSDQMHSDLELKKRCLMPFLQWLRDRYHITKYIWRGELQENGNIHFHIVTDTFIHYLDLRKNWNGHLARLGYINAFEKKHGHDDPNSTDIHSIKKIHNLGAYLSKYMAKNDDKKKVSTNLSGKELVRSGNVFGRYNVSKGPVLDKKSARIRKVFGKDVFFKIKAMDQSSLSSGPVLDKKSARIRKVFGRSGLVVMIGLISGLSGGSVSVAQGMDVGVKNIEWNRSVTSGEITEKRVFEGKWFGISQRLSNMRTSPISEGSALWNLLFEACEREKPVVFRDDYFSVVFLSIERFIAVSATKDLVFIHDHLTDSGFKGQEIRALFANAHRPTRNPTQAVKRSSSPSSLPVRPPPQHHSVRSPVGRQGTPTLRAPQSQLILQLHHA